MRRILCVMVLVVVTCLVGVSCKSPALDCRYNLTVTWQERKSVTEPVPLETARVFVFYADASQWEVTSIEDARNGIATSVNNPGQQISYDEELLPVGPDNNVFQAEFTDKPVMLLVVDTKYDMWATGNANVVEGLPNMYVTIKFAPLDWKEGQTLPVEKKPWKFYGYDDVVIPVDTELFIKPTIWHVGSLASDIMTVARCYAYYDFSKSNGGRVISWAQASSGIAEYQEEEGSDVYVEVPYSVSGEWSGEMMKMDIGGNLESIMVVVYNEAPGVDEERVYAYSYLDLTSNPVRDTLNLLVDLRKSGDSWTYNTWNIAVERPDDGEGENGSTEPAV